MTMRLELDHVSELRPPTGLLFITQVIYEHGKPWWNGNDKLWWKVIGRGKLFCPAELPGILPAESSSSRVGYRRGE
jgi:hypothetical protein